VYVSFNAGDQWRPLQLNLPDTPIRDLVIKDNDLVLGTHGRGFWILDDIGPLREMRPETMVASAALFQPSTATRRVDDALIQYYLRDSVEAVTVEILDAGGNLVRSFESTAGSNRQRSDDDDDSFFGRGTRPPTRAVGLNRFVWDLRYPGATTFDGMIIWSGRPQAGPMAPPGRYQVRLTAGSFTATQTFDVRKDPRLSGVTDEDLHEQFRLASEIRDKTSLANETVIQIRDIKKQVNDRVQQTNDRGVHTAADAFLQKISAVEEELYQVRNRSGQDPLNFPIKLNNRLASLRRSVETGDAKPTDAAHTVLEELSTELAGHLGRLDTILIEDLRDLNRRLQRANLDPIQIPPRGATTDQ